MAVERAGMEAIFTGLDPAIDMVGLTQFKFEASASPVGVEPLDGFDNFHWLGFGGCCLRFRGQYGFPCLWRCRRIGGDHAAARCRGLTGGIMACLLLVRCVGISRFAYREDITISEVGLQ